MTRCNRSKKAASLSEPSSLRPALDEGLRAFMLGVYNNMVIALALSALVAVGINKLAVAGSAHWRHRVPPLRFTHEAPERAFERRQERDSGIDIWPVARRRVSETPCSYKEAG